MVVLLSDEVTAFSWSEEDQGYWTGPGWAGNRFVYNWCGLILLNSFLALFSKVQLLLSLLLVRPISFVVRATIGTSTCLWTRALGRFEPGADGRDLQQLQRASTRHCAAVRAETGSNQLRIRAPNTAAPLRNSGSGQGTVPRRTMRGSQVRTVWR